MRCVSGATKGRTLVLNTSDHRNATRIYSNSLGDIWFQDICIRGSDALNYLAVQDRPLAGFRRSGAVARFSAREQGRPIGTARCLGLPAEQSGKALYRKPPRNRSPQTRGNPRSRVPARIYTGTTRYP